jgi:GT2 family glycosyltransferase
MQPRVTAILVVRNGGEFLEHTLAALGSQTRPPDSVVFVDSGSTDSSSAMLAAANPTQYVTETAKRGFGSAVSHGLHVAYPATSDNDWIWLLRADSAPRPHALANLLAAVEIAPSVAIAGPKLMRWDHPDVIAGYGETLTTFGSSVALVVDELDQAQHDDGSDQMGVAAAGMLVRRSVWVALGGFDPALPSIDAALDFSIRARLAGHRVVVVPNARVLTAGGPELFGRKSVSTSARAAIRRAAQLHRRMVYSHRAVLPLHWLTLVPLAVLRSIAHLINKQPGSIGGEFRTALRAAFSPSVGDARRNLKKTRILSWSAIAPFRISSSDARELRAQRREIAETVNAAPVRTRVGFFSGGGAWAVLLAAVIGVISFSPLLGAPALAGGALAPLSTSVGELWANVGWGWHSIGAGFVGASDPFAAVLAVLGSLTFWSPSLSIVLLYLAALPLAALGAWWCAVRLTERAWPPAVAALVWALAPPFLSSMTDGHLGAVIAHILLPWLILAVLAASRSWSAGAAAALLFAAVTASAPILIPALLVAWLAWMIARPSRIRRLFGLIIPAAALFAPLVTEQLRRGNWFGWLAEPGVPTIGTTATGWHLALGIPDASLNGWESAGKLFGLVDVSGPVLAAILLAPFAVLALLSLFLPGSRRAATSLVLALLGFATAVGGTHLQLTLVGSQAVGVWPGAGLSLFWLGLTGAVVIALDALGGRSVVPALVLALASTLAVGPLLAAPLSGHSAVTAGTTTTLPAFVAAEAKADPLLGTLQLDPQPNGGLAVTLHRGQATTLDEQSTFAATTTTVSPAEKSLATLAGNLASSSGLDLPAALNTAHVGFVLVPPAAAGASRAARGSAVDALNGNELLNPVGVTPLGALWHYQQLSDAKPATGVSTTGSALGIGILAAQAFIFFITLLLAVPTSRGRNQSTVADSGEITPGFDEDDNV